MEHKFTTPISVHFLIHKDCSNLKELKKYLYGLLCRDTDNPQIDGLDIPVFFHIGGGDAQIPIITDVDSKHQIIVPIVDEAMFCDSTWEKYIAELLQTINKDNQQYTISPVAISKYAFQLNPEIQKRQFIKLSTYSVLENKNEFQIRLFDVIIRHLGILSPDDKSVLPSNDKIKVFISHSKRDIDHAGENCAVGLRDYLRHYTKLDSFFDANDILDGEFFGDSITHNIKNSIFVIISSDTYSDREWCRYEALQSKYEKVPSIRVDVTSNYSNRIFPYMANIPAIRFKDNWEEIVALMMRTTLDWYYQLKYLENLKSVFPDKQLTVEATVPELISILYSHKDSKAVLYPEPPLGKEELEMFGKTCSDKRFYTPMQLQTEGLNLTGKHIAISVSEPSDEYRHITGSERIRDISTEIVRHLLAAKANLVFGGDLRKTNNFTKIIGELSFQYLESQHSNSDIKCFKNYFAWPIWKNINRDEELYLKLNRVDYERCEAPSSCPFDLKDTFVPPNTKQNKLLWAESLTIMRYELENFADALVALGGRLNNFKGFMPGVIQEVGIALEMHKPIYLIGAFGGAIQLLSKCVTNEITPEEAINNIIVDSELSEVVKSNGISIKTLDYLNNIYSNGLTQFDNGLSEVENIRLMTSVNITEIVSLILKGLSKKFK